jgi:hypothetical protein
VQAAPQAKAAGQSVQTHQGHQAQGRKKKKFFQKGSATAAQPGNSISGPSQGKRKGKQKGPREFVGPMDHSYRAVNGNISDGPPSTIQITSNGHNSHYQESYVPEPALPVREDAPTRIFCFIEDLFFQAKIQETARKLGVKVEFVKGAADAAGLRPEQPECQADDADSEVQGQAEEGNLDHRLSESPAERSETEGDRGWMRHGDAAVGFFAEPAEPAAPLWDRRGRRVRPAAGVSGAG